MVPAPAPDKSCDSESTYVSATEWQQSRSSLTGTTQVTLSKGDISTTNGVFSNAQRNAKLDAFQTFELLISHFRHHKVKGPQLLRVATEFTNKIGEGASFIVHGLGKALSRELEADDTLQLSERSRSRVLAHQLRTIAIKRSSPRNSMKDQVQAIWRETYTLARSACRNSPNIVQLQAWGLDLDVLESNAPNAAAIPLIILERAQMNLTQLMRNLEPEDGFSAEFLGQICLDIGHGLQALHEDNVVHADMKPDNVLIFFHDDGKVVAKICDFGFSGQDHDDVPAERTVYHGTTGWRPPEVMHSKASIPIGSLRLCDIFAYGLIVWSTFLRHGQTPFGPDEGRRALEASGGALETALNDIYWNKRLSWVSSLLLRRIFMETLQHQAGHRNRRPWAAFAPFLHYLKSTHARDESGQNHTSLQWALSAHLAMQLLLRPIRNSHNAGFALGTPQWFVYLSHLAVWSPLSAPRALYKSIINMPLTFVRQPQFEEFDFDLKERARRHLMLSITVPQLRAQNPNHLQAELSHIERLREPDPQKAVDLECAVEICGWLRHELYDLLKLGRRSLREDQVSKLYGLAFLRSKIPLCCWKASVLDHGPGAAGNEEHFDGMHGTEEYFFDRSKRIRAHFEADEPVYESLLELALHGTHAIPTLAWLMHGPVGEAELAAAREYDDFCAAFLERRQLPGQKDSWYRAQVLLLLIDRGCRADVVDTWPSNAERTWIRAFLGSIETDTPVSVAFCNRLMAHANLGSISAPEKFYANGLLPDGAAQAETISTCKTTLLHDCALTGHYDAVSFLIGKNFPPDVRDSMGRTALKVLTSRMSSESRSRRDARKGLAGQHDRIKLLLGGTTAGSDSLARGWTEEESIAGCDVTGSSSSRSKLCWVEEKTQSLTFTKPSFSLFSDRRLALGYRRLVARSADGERQVYYVDPWSLLHPPEAYANDSQPLAPPGTGNMPALPRESLTGGPQQITVYGDDWFARDPRELLGHADYNLVGSWSMRSDHDHTVERQSRWDGTNSQASSTRWYGGPSVAARHRAYGRSI
jgi:serine/threonine protein kinase